MKKDLEIEPRYNEGPGNWDWRNLSSRINEVSFAVSRLTPNLDITSLLPKTKLQSEVQVFQQPAV